MERIVLEGFRQSFFGGSTSSRRSRTRSGGDGGSSCGNDLRDKQEYLKLIEKEYQRVEREFGVRK